MLWKVPRVPGRRSGHGRVVHSRTWCPESKNSATIVPCPATSTPACSRCRAREVADVQRWNLPEGWVIRPRGPAGRRHAGTCWPGWWRAGDGWNRPGPTASPPTGAATAIPAPPDQNMAGRRTPMYARTRSCRTSPPWPSCWAPITRPRAAAPSSSQPQTAGLIDQLRASGAVLTYDPSAPTAATPSPSPRARTADTHNGERAEGGTAAAKTPATAEGRARVTIPHARKRADMGINVPEGDLIPARGGTSPNRGSITTPN